MEALPVQFKFENVNAISQKQFEVHMELYNGYVKKINEITYKLINNGGRQDANATYSLYRGLKKGETYALNGVILHELYFSNLGGTSNMPSITVRDIISRYFGSFENWRDDFIACGKAARGWAILTYDSRTGMLRNVLCDAHDEGPIWTDYPLIVMDVYEHAYYVDYPNKKDEYINRFIGDINWTVVDKRFSDIFGKSMLINRIFSSYN